MISIIKMLGIAMDIKDRLKSLWFTLLGKNHNQNNCYEIQFGELIVSNKGESEIKIKCQPKHIRVEFNDPPNITPCNPHHDKLFWSVKKIHGNYMFIINWNVSGVREIKWTIKY